MQDAPLAAIQQAIEAGGQSLDLSTYGDYLRHLIHIREYLFADDRPFAQCHASTLVQLKNGAFLAAWFGGTREGQADVGIWGAERRHGRWSAPRCLAKVRDCAHWNPVLHASDDGCVYLFFKVGERIADWETWVMESDDDGQTWERASGTSAGRPGRARAGQKQAPRARRRHVAGRGLAGKRGVGGLCRSQRGPRGNLAGPRSHSTRTARSLPATARSNRRFGNRLRGRCICWSAAPAGGSVAVTQRTEGGLGRRSIRRTCPNNNSGLDLARLHDGTLALVCNPVERTRTPLSILLSSDNGQTWPRRLDLETADGEYSYPAIIPTQVGMAITYTWV